jgi:hypothetical protein
LRGNKHINMKHLLTPFLLVTGFFSMMACNQPATLTQADSAAVASDYMKRHPEVEKGNAPVGTFYQPINGDRVKIGEDSLDRMRYAYDSAMPFKIPNSNPDPKYKYKYSTGYVIDPVDFADLVKQANAGRVLTIGMHFAIRNFNEFAKGDTAIYTMEVVPVGMDTMPFPPNMRTVIAGPKTPKTTTYGYDFVDPCPGGQGCPPPTAN